MTAATSSSVQYGKPQPACVEISYRDEKHGGGAFYDHCTIQQTTQHRTCMSVSQKMSSKDFESYCKSVATFKLPFPVKSTQQTERVGLLLIPGRSKNTEEKRKEIFVIRNEHEEALLHDAKKRGRPILGICGGCLQIWSSFGGTFEEAVGHTSRRMPCMRKNGTVGHNVQKHRVAIEHGSMLDGALTERKHWKRTAQKISEGSSPSLVEEKKRLLYVNSVHWLVPSTSTHPDGETFSVSLTINAVSKKKPATANILKFFLSELELREMAKNAVPTTPVPREGLVEGFEQRSGAPILGIQWHPEAYDKGDNRNLLVYMAKAGDAYAAKQDMLAELKEKIAQCEKIKSFLKMKRIPAWMLCSKNLSVQARDDSFTPEFAEKTKPVIREKEHSQKSKLELIEKEREVKLKLAYIAETFAERIRHEIIGKKFADKMKLVIIGKEGSKKVKVKFVKENITEKSDLECIAGEFADKMKLVIIEKKLVDKIKLKIFGKKLVEEFKLHLP